LKGQGARAKNRRKILVEATEGCNISRGKFARKDQVHKIRKQILSTCATLVQKIFSKVREKILFLKVYSVETREQQVFQAFLQVFMQNGKVGEGDVFSRKKHIYCFICIKTSE
jgi:hypothetical protein